MKTINIPFGRGTAPLHVDERNLKAVITAELDEYKPALSEEELIRAAMRSPIGSAPLRELAAGKQKIVIVTSDHTRAVPSKITLPILLEELRAGSPGADITILIATGLHRPTTEEEQRRMFGDSIVDKEKIAVNHAFEPAEFTDMGTLPSGSRLQVNSLVTDCDLLITEGLIEPHFFAGFSGGCKSILPGVCSSVTVNENHSYKAISSPFAATGVLKDNPIHDDMICAARRVNVQFILNVVLNAEKKVIGAFAGDLEAAHSEGVSFIRSLSQCGKVTGDIVITSNGGYPLDQNLYQSPKSAATAEACAGEDGVIILCASCLDGMGGTHFAEYISSGTVEEIDKRLAAVAPSETVSETWCVQIFCRMLKKHKMILVSGLDAQTVKKCNMIPAKTPDEALEIAYTIKGKDAEVVVIPDGVAALVG